MGAIWKSCLDGILIQKFALLSQDNATIALAFELEMRLRLSSFGFSVKVVVLIGSGEKIHRCLQKVYICNLCAETSRLHTLTRCRSTFGLSN